MNLSSDSCLRSKMVFGSEKRDIEILATIVGITIVLLIWFSTRCLGSYCKKSLQPSKRTSKNIEEGINFSLKTQTPPIVSNDYSFTHEKEFVEDLELDEFHTNDESRLYDHRSRAWLDTWQSKIHRSNLYSKSVLELILPTTSTSEDNTQEMFFKSPTGRTSSVKSPCDNEMLVVPAIMTSGMCDHNLALGTFLWSPKTGSAVSKGDSRRRTTSEGVIPDNFSPKKRTNNNGDHCCVSKSLSGCSCGSNHDSFCSVTAPASEFVSALSSGKTSLSKVDIRKRQGLVNGCRIGSRVDINLSKNMTNSNGRHSTVSTILSSPSSASSSASALSPPPPSRASFSFLLPSSNGNILNKSRDENNINDSYPLRYKIQNQRYEVSLSPVIQTSTLSSPTTFECNSNNSSLKMNDKRNNISKIDKIEKNPFNLNFDNEEINHFVI